MTVTADTITDDQIRELKFNIGRFDTADATEIMRAYHAIGATGKHSPHWYRRRRAARERCAEIFNVKCCKHCGEFVIEHRVYFGVVGPFCDVSCREAYLKQEADHAAHS